MKVTETDLKGCFIIEPQIFRDARGLFFEAFHKEKLQKSLGVALDFLQDNVSLSHYGVLRGLHFQNGERAQAKLVQVMEGKVLDVVVDLRPNSATFGKHIKIILSKENRKSIFIPKGMAHGFVVVSPEATFSYKCDAYYNNAAEGGIKFDDPDLSIDWDFPLDKIILSKKDQVLPAFKELFP